MIACFRITFLLVAALLCAPAWADDCKKDKDGNLECGKPDCVEITSEGFSAKAVPCLKILAPHNCSLLTIAYNGTVSVAQGLTKKIATRMSMDLSPNEYNGGMREPKPVVQRTEVFCDDDDL